MGELDLVQDLAIVMTVAGLAGFLCHKIGLSSIVGFLLAGFLVGPNSSSFSYIRNEQTIQALSQLGLVFLLFSIGMELSFGKMRRMGFGVVLAVTVSAVLVFNLVRSTSPMLGVGKTETLFVSGMVIASSSAIIGKILHDTGLIHQRAGNLAMSITIMEDLVAVVVLTFISSVAKMHSGPGAGLGRTVGVLLSFVTVVAVPGLLFLPRILTRLNRAGADLLTITVAGLALAIGVISVRTGYSLALGGFLLGTIIAETPQRPLVQRALLGMKDIFIALFFVSIGMAINPALVLKNWTLILGLGILTVLVRLFAASLALILTGTPNRDAIRAGFMLTPIGEFAFIIAQLGVSSGMLPADYYPIAIGAAMFTAFVSPPLIQHSGILADRVVRLEPKYLRNLISLYQQFLDSICASRSRSEVLTLAQRKLIPFLVSLVFTSGVLIFAPALHQLWIRFFPGNAEDLPHNLFWVGLGIFVMIPVFSVWHRLSDFLGVLVEVGSTASNHRRRPLLQGALQLIAAFLLYLWFWLLTPVSGANRWFFGSILVSAILFGLIFGRRVRAIQSGLALELQAAVLSAEERRMQTREAWLQEHRDWDLHLSEIEVPDSSTWFGKNLGELRIRSQYGCSVVGVDRQGYPLSSPGPETELFPNDTLLLLGTKDQIRGVQRYFDSSKTEPGKGDVLNEIRLESMEISDGSRLEGRSLGELEISRRTGVQIAGVGRGAYRMLFPGPSQTLQVGDNLLVVGTSEQIRVFRDWSAEPAAGSKGWEIGI